MGPPVTEVALVRIVEGADPDTAMVGAAETLHAQPGCQLVRWATEHENPHALYAFVDWDKTASHELFMTTDAYNTFRQQLAPLLAESPIVYHVAFKPFPPIVLNNNLWKGKREATTTVVELLHAYFPASYSTERQEKTATDVERYMKHTKIQARGATGESAVGWAEEELDYKGEKARLLLIAFGWESIDAHIKYQGTDAFSATVSILKGLEELKGFTVGHVSNYVVEKDA
ncbi:hypothetical protein BKA66DRAFT_480016 [Pyrenochaeta sp. MPI-SDFR-AT-0127]|nr:hypothetical protein BKA66DRAFT_480016 [Pyrenochaeta sp. MPI-SDFR-AT-0127]